MGRVVKSKSIESVGITPSQETVSIREFPYGKSFKFLTIGEPAFWMRVNRPELSWREIAERVSPEGRVLNGETVREHASTYVERVWLGNEEMRVYLKRRGKEDKKR